MGDGSGMCGRSRGGRIHTCLSQQRGSVAAQPERYKKGCWPSFLKQILEKDFFFVLFLAETNPVSHPFQVESCVACILCFVSVGKESFHFDLFKRTCYPHDPVRECPTLSRRLVMLSR